MSKAGLVRWIWLAFVVTLAPDARAQAAAPQLARQILLPLLAKSDWQSSSFSDDGRLLLVVDESRSFVVDVESGRELRPLRASESGPLIWARPRPDSYEWIGVTTAGRLVRIDVASGTSEQILDLADWVAQATYRTKNITFEFVGPSELVAFVRTPRERPNEGGGTYRWEDQTMLSFDVISKQVTGLRPVSSDEFFTNLDARVVARPGTGFVGIFDPKSTAPITIWTLNNAQAAERFSLACSISQGADSHAVALVPYREGFVAFAKPMRADYLGREMFASPRCQPGAAADAGTSASASGCQWTLAGATLIAAAPGATDGEFVIVRHGLALETLRLSLANCRSAASELANLWEFYPAWRTAKAMQIPADTSLTAAEEITIKFIPARNGYAVNVGGGLSWIGVDPAPPRLVVDLLGSPSGVLEIESGPGFVVGWRILGPLKIFDARGARLRSLPFDHGAYYKNVWVYHKPYAVLRGTGAVALLEFDGRLSFHAARADIDTTKLPKPARLAVEQPGGFCASEDGNQILVVSKQSLVQRFQRHGASGSFKEAGRLNLGPKLDLFKVACDRQASQAVLSDSLTDNVFVVDASKTRLALRQTLRVEGSSNSLARPSLTSDALLLGVRGQLFMRQDRNGPFVAVKVPTNPERLIFSADGRQLLAVGPQTALYDLTRSGTRWALQARQTNFGIAGDGAFLDDQTIVLVRSAEDLDVRTVGNAPLGQLSFGEGEDWLFADASGRFDVNDIERQTAGFWVMPDDPLRALAPEIFMRDYYEPRLMNRLIACRKQEAASKDACSAFGTRRSVASLNRAQPAVEIVSVEPEAGRPDEVAVTVAVEGVRRVFGEAGQERAYDSGVYDLRLFRGGQLVGQFPDAESVDTTTTSASEDELQQWRARRNVMENAPLRTVVFRNIRLPRGQAGDSIDFTAYAFNHDRVKSRTATRAYALTRTVAAQRRAFLVAVGVSAYESAVWDLQYADNDARRLASVLAPRLAATGRYDEIVSVTLTSAWKKGANGARTLRAADATKRNIKAVIDVLAGTGQAEAVPRGAVSGGALSKAGPDDTVLILYSSHGYVDPKGIFFVFPFDIGNTPVKRVSDEILQRAISSDELSAWLRKVDAGEMIMILDACHSAASIEGSGFKPGPMGSRGLGQLSYDKGMRILASTRADDLAWESGNTRQGLLSFALLQDGIVAGKADYRPTNGIIGIGEWLGYAAERVPQLYKDDRTRSGARGAPRLTVFDEPTRRSRRVEAGGVDVASQTQQPALFNFRHGADPDFIRNRK
jgi:hypothetical protein